MTARPKGFKSRVGLIGLGHRSAHQMWSAATRRRFPNHAATSRRTPQIHPSG